MFTDNGTHFTDPKGEARAPEEIKTSRAQKAFFRCHAFEAACADPDIEHRLTKPRHPWTNGQVERMNRTIRVLPSSVSITTVTANDVNTFKISSTPAISPDD